MTKASLGIIALTILLWPLSAAAAPPCEVVQLDREMLSRCIDEMQKEIERNRSEIERLKTQNSLMTKQLCMVAIEQHRKNANSEALKLIIESACAKFRKTTVPEKRS